MKIAVVGNAGGGKTVLSRRLGQRLNIPVTHVDSIQFLPGMIIRPHQESINVLLEVQSTKDWIIDGYGPLDILIKRFEVADRIIFVDFPIWHHYWWCTKRQIQNLWSPRQELPSGCDERSWAHTWKLFKTLWRTHKKMRPELLRIFSREAFAKKVVFIRTMSEWNKIFKNGLDL